MTSPRTVAILGSTGSIGTQALDVVARNPDRFRVTGPVRGVQPRPRRGAGRRLRGGPRRGRHRDLRAGRRGDRCVCRPRRPRGIPAPDRGRGRRGGDRRWVRRGRRAQRHHRFDRSPAHSGGAGRGLGAGTGQQGVAHRRRTPGEGRCATRPDRPGGLRALRHRAEPARRTRRGGPPTRRHRQRRTVPGPVQGIPARRHPRSGARPPELLDGQGHHDQLGDPGQQGAGGDRGAPALRHPLRPDRRRRPPAADDPLDGGVRRRLDDRAGGSAADARADRSRAVVAGAPRRRRRAGATGPAHSRGSSSRWTTRRSPPCGWPGRWGRRPAPTPRSTTQPTRWRSTRSTTVGSGSSTSSTRSTGWSHDHATTGGEGIESATLSVEDVLRADSWARDRARTVLGLADGRPTERLSDAEGALR